MAVGLYLPLHCIFVRLCMLWACKAVTSEIREQLLVRIAELEIDPAQLVAYTTALKEEISTSIRMEPGVLTLYAVAVKDHPDQIRIFETYVNQFAHETYAQSPHFKKYKSKTQGMVRSLKLVGTKLILLGVKRVSMKWSA